MSRNVILIAVIVVIAWYFYFKSTDKQQQIISPETSEQQSLSQGNSQTTETEDEQLIENLVKEGIIEKIELDGNSPKVYITADFYRIPNEDKKAIMEVLYKNFTTNNPEVTSFTVYDAKSGDEVATYDANGLKRR